MTEPRRRFDIEPKTGIPTLGQWAAYKRQAALYTEGIFQGYRGVSPMPAGDWPPIEVDYAKLEARLQGVDHQWVAQYSRADAQFTMEWWRKYWGGPSPYPNKLRAKDNQVASSAELLHWDTVLSMASPPHKVTAVPDFGCDCRFRCRR